MKFKVKEGTVPPPVFNRPNPKYPWSTTKVGGMFFVPGAVTRVFSTLASKKGKQLGMKFSTQSAVMRQDLQSDEWELCQKGEAGSKTGVLVKRVK